MPTCDLGSAGLRGWRMFTHPASWQPGAGTDGLQEAGTGRAWFLQARHQDCSPSWLCSRRKKSLAGLVMWHLLQGLDTTVGSFTTGRDACIPPKPPLTPRLLTNTFCSIPIIPLVATAKLREAALGRLGTQLPCSGRGRTKECAAATTGSRSDGWDPTHTFMQSLHCDCRPSAVRL